MVARAHRLALAYATRQQGGIALRQSSDTPVTLADYSDFKYGDARVAANFGRALCDLVVRELRGAQRILVTTSAFNAVPPSAHAMLQPFLVRAAGHGLDVTAFTVHRATVSDGDYAAMSVSERREQVLRVPLRVASGVSLAGANVVALDDARVTGTHELAMDSCLTAARRVLHAYVIDAHAESEHPRIETELNATGLKSVEQIVALAARPDFAPNARFCKWVITRSESERREVLVSLPPAVKVWLRAAIVTDKLHEVPSYREGSLMILAHVQA